MSLLWRLKTFSATVGAFVVSAANAATPYVWKNVQIHGGGFVTGVVFHPAEHNLIYARTDVGGAFRWNSAAGRWIPLNDDRPLVSARCGLSHRGWRRDVDGRHLGREP